MELDPFWSYKEFIPAIMSTVDTKPAWLFYLYTILVQWRLDDTFLYQGQKESKSKVLTETANLFLIISLQA